MLKKRLIIVLTLVNGSLYGTRNFKPDHLYSYDFVDTWDIDEIILLNIGKKDNDDLIFLNTLKNFSKKCFVPITVGGKINNLQKAEQIFKNGADKISINTALKDKKLVEDFVRNFGSSSIVGSIDFKKKNGKDFIFSHNDGNFISSEPIDYIKNIEDLGVGEILIQSVERDGTLLGFDTDLLNSITKDLNIPFIASSGGGNWKHFLNCFKKTLVSGLATTNIHHFTNKSIRSAKSFLLENNIDVRPPS